MVHVSIQIICVFAQCFIAYKRNWILCLILTCKENFTEYALARAVTEELGQCKL